VLNFVNVRLSIPARSALIGAPFIAPIVSLTFIFLLGTLCLIEIWPRFPKSSASADAISTADGAEVRATGLEEINFTINQMDQMTRQNTTMVEESWATSHPSTNPSTNLVSRFPIVSQEFQRAPQAPARDQDRQRAAEPTTGGSRAA